MSEKTPNEKPKVTKVVSGDVKTKKRPDSMLAEDMSNVGSYVLEDIIVPTLKDLFFNIIKNGADMLIYGGSGSKRSGRQTNVDNVSYRSFYNDRNRDRRDYDRPATRTRYSYDDITIADRGEAEAVLDTMIDILSTYGIVSVADLYDLVGVQGSFTDQKYGWTNLRNARIVRARFGSGYKLELPKALPID